MCFLQRPTTVFKCWTFIAILNKIIPYSQNLNPIYLQFLKRLLYDIFCFLVEVTLILNWYRLLMFICSVSKTISTTTPNALQFLKKNKNFQPNTGWWFHLFSFFPPFWETIQFDQLFFQMGWNMLKPPSGMLPMAFLFPGITGIQVTELYEAALQGGLEDIVQSHGWYRVTLGAPGSETQISSSQTKACIVKYS